MCYTSNFFFFGFLNFYFALKGDLSEFLNEIIEIIS